MSATSSAAGSDFGADDEVTSAAVGLILGQAHHIFSRLLNPRIYAFVSQNGILLPKLF